MESARLDLAKLAPLASTYCPTVDELNRPLTELPEGANEALIRAMPRSR